MELRGFRGISVLAAALLCCVFTGARQIARGADRQPQDQAAIQTRLKELKSERLTTARSAFETHQGSFLSKQDDRLRFGLLVDRVLLDAQLAEAATPVDRIEPLKQHLERATHAADTVIGLHAIGARGGEEEEFVFGVFTRVAAEIALCEAMLAAVPKGGGPAAKATLAGRLKGLEIDRKAELAELSRTSVDALSDVGQVVDGIWVLDTCLSFALAGAKEPRERIKALEQDLTHCREFEAKLAEVQKKGERRVREYETLAAKLRRQTSEIELLLVRLQDHSPAGSKIKAAGGNNLSDNPQLRDLVAQQGETDKLLLDAAKAAYENRTSSLRNALAISDELLSADMAVADSPGERIPALEQNLERVKWFEQACDSRHAEYPAEPELVKALRQTAEIKLLEAQIAQPDGGKDQTVPKKKP
jgi:hypothetical protein